MIFVTVGSTHWRFDRLMQALERVRAEHLYVQHGPAQPPSTATRVAPFLGFPDVLAAMADADSVVCHAGAGTILCALRLGHTPIVVPRLATFKEAVDQHQLELATTLAESRSVISVLDLEELPEVLRTVPPRRSAPRPRNVALANALAMALDAPPALGRAARPRRRAGVRRLWRAA